MTCRLSRRVGVLLFLPRTDVHATHLAATKSWLQTFRGTTDVLRNRIRRYMDPSTPHSEPYARCAVYCQSSGTGKSRMVDELAKEIICIPINLGPWDGG